ncbi:MAG: ABC transporter permease subunit [Pseudomonadota bacterium]
MLRMIFQRLIIAVPTLFVIITLAFAMIKVAPGGPFDGERALSKAVQDNLNRQYKLDRPLLEQYAHYVGGVVRGDFGPSFQYRDQSVTGLIRQGLPASILVGGIALLCALGAGLGLGVWAAQRAGRLADRLVMAAAATGLALPSFVIAPLLALVFGVALRWVPVAGWGAPGNLILPVIALAIPYAASIARLTRAGVVEVSSAPFVRTARGKNISQARLLWRHILPRALMPVVSYLGPAAAGILTGSVVIETIFQIPGIGRYFVQGALNRDFTLVMGVVIVYAALIIVFNLIVDIALQWLDPRTRGQST